MSFELYNLLCYRINPVGLTWRQGPGCNVRIQRAVKNCCWKMPEYDLWVLHRQKRTLP